MYFSILLFLPGSQIGFEQFKKIYEIYAEFSAEAAGKFLQYHYNATKLPADLFRRNRSLNL